MKYPEMRSFIIMTNPTAGIHHITAIASNPQQNINFYHMVLGQRFIKSTVNFDDPGTHHFYYGDRSGSPGTILTFFPWPGAKKGRLGSGETGTIAYSIHPDSIDYWAARLQSFHLQVGNIQNRFGDSVLPFVDPDGLRMELIAHPNLAEIDFWQDGPVPKAHALRGFHGVTLMESEIETTARVLTETLGFKMMDQQGKRTRFKANSNAAGSYVDLLHTPSTPRGKMGAGTVHHIAFRTSDDEEQARYHKKVSQAGLNITSVRDRQYFRSVYFREPGGVLIELATDGPGFTIDESPANLGTSLKLPAWFESNREAIETALPPFTIPEISYA
jgi:glyoxalase family protein